MKTKLFIVPLLCSVLLGGAAEPQKIDLTALKMGVPAPKVEGDTLCFSAAAETAAAAALNAPLDFSQGGRIELEFLDEGQQSNPFPRLVEGSAISLHFESNEGKKDKIFKVVVNDAAGGNFNQLRFPCRHREGAWHKAVFEIDPAQKLFSLSLDGERRTAPLTVSPQLQQLRFILGATAMSNSVRGFNGRIRNLHVTCGYAISPDRENAERRINLALLETGNPAPELVPTPLGPALAFNAAAGTAAAARLSSEEDFSHGARIELEFMDDVKQGNPFPRLLESGAVSLHFEAGPEGGNGDKILKVLLTDKESRAINQLKLPLRYQAGIWHKAVVELDPVNRVHALSLDGERVSAPITVSPSWTKLRFILGATSMQGSTRGFCGQLRNLVIVKPYAIPAAGAGAFRAGKVTAGVRYVKICAVRGRHYAFPGVTVLPGGELAAVFREGLSHVDPYGRICIAYSRDGGRNWSSPVVVADTATDERDPAIITLPDGRVLLTHGGWNSWMYYRDGAKSFPGETAYIEQSGAKQYGGSKYLFSADGGYSFSPPVSVPVFAPHGPAVAGDGSFLQSGITTRNGKRTVVIYSGSADGKQWKKLADVAEMTVGNSLLAAAFEEPHTAVLADGTIVVGIRIPQPGDGYMRICRSTDGGKSWSAPVKTPVRGYPQYLLPLKDGRLLAVYGYRYAPYGIRGCISRDGGITWDIEHEIVLRNDGANDDLGYPVAVEMPNGEVLCVYYMNDDRHDNCYIEGAFFRP